MGHHFPSHTACKHAGQQAVVRVRLAMARLAADGTSAWTANSAVLAGVPPAAKRH